MNYPLVVSSRYARWGASAHEDGTPLAVKSAEFQVAMRDGVRRHSSRPPTALGTVSSRYARWGASAPGPNNDTVTPPTIGFQVAMRDGVRRHPMLRRQPPPPLFQVAMRDGVRRHDLNPTPHCSDVFQVAMRDGVRRHPQVVLRRSDKVERSIPAHRLGRHAPVRVAPAPCASFVLVSASTAEPLCAL